MKLDILNSPVLPPSPSTSLLVEPQSGLLHPLVELRSTCSGGDDEFLPVLLSLDVPLGGNRLVYPLIYAHQDA